MAKAASISVFGLGYVGAVSGACFAEMGHRVVGVDIDEFKVNTINGGGSPIVEDLIGELTAEMVGAGRLRATMDVEEAVMETDLSMVCVGTPSTASGGLDSGYVRRVAEQIGSALKAKEGYHLVVIRSTVLPGTVEEVVGPALESHSGRQVGADLGLCFHPEFLREGSSVADFRDPPKIVIGAQDDRAAGMLAALYEGFNAPLFTTSTRAAEMVKYADNAFHALKVVFGNEIGALCKAMGMDSHEVMRIFCEDRKLNISPAYLMPGFAYGGSCLPKDLRALLSMARAQDLDLPLLSNVHRSNEAHVLRTLERIQDLGKRNVAMLGLSFKAGTDDLRESPLVELAERLVGKGYRVRIFDENVSVSRLRGGNKAYIEEKLPHISELLVDDLEGVVACSDVVVIGAASARVRETLKSRSAGKYVLDLVRLFEHGMLSEAHYEGVCW